MLKNALLNATQIVKIIFYYLYLSFLGTPSKKANVDSQKEVKCRKCTETFFDTDTFKKHMFLYHGTKCNVIDIDFKNSGNKILNSKVNFPNASENIETSVSTAKRKNTTPQAQILICNQCPKRSSVICFVDQSALDNHIKNVHTKLELKSEPNENIKPNSLNRSMPDIFQNMIKTVQIVKKSPTFEVVQKGNNNIKSELASTSMPDVFQNMIKTVEVVKKHPAIQVEQKPNDNIKPEPLNTSMPDFYQNMIKTVQVVQKPPTVEVVQKKPVSYNYRCNVCGLRFAEQQKMMSHLFADHSIKL